jgi:hypothetical protein
MVLPGGAKGASSRIAAGEEETSERKAASKVIRMKAKVRRQPMHARAERRGQMTIEKSITAAHVTPLAALDPEFNPNAREGHFCEVCKKLSVVSQTIKTAAAP